MSRRSSAGSIFWGLTLVAIGGLLLARNMGYNIPIWTGLARYWPVLIIVWGLLKLVDYYNYRRTGQDRPLFSGGEVALLILVILTGSAITTAANISPELGGIFQIGDIDFWDITGNNYQYTERQELGNIAADSTIEILNLYGAVEVSPADVDRITVEIAKTIRAPSKEEADRLVQDFTFSIKSQTGGYKIVSSRDDFVTDGRIGYERQRFKSSMIVHVPKRSMLKIDNRNGKVTVENLVGRQTITNRYGQVFVHGITGALELENRNGSVDVADISESAKITTSYAGVDAKNIGGMLEVDNRNGSVEVETVKGNTTITTSYSGVEVRGVTGTLDVQNRNGSVEAEDISLSAKITTSYSSVSAKNVGGTIQVTNRNGSITVVDIKGDATLSTSYAPITASNVQGLLRIDGRNNGVDVEHVTGEVNIQSSYQNISIRDPKSAVTVRNRNGDILIAFAQPPAKDVTVNGEYSNVTLEMPNGSSFSIDAQTRYGRVESDFEITTSGVSRRGDEREQSITGRTGTGGPLIKIDTRNGSIQLDRRG